MLVDITPLDTGIFVLSVPAIRPILFCMTQWDLPGLHSATACSTRDLYGRFFVSIHCTYGPFHACPQSRKLFRWNMSMLPDIRQLFIGGDFHYHIIVRYRGVRVLGYSMYERRKCQYKIITLVRSPACIGLATGYTRILALTLTA